MDAYTSLLNLNFMSAWRTGNSFIDIVIAMIIPLISNAVSRFFLVTWPYIVKKIMEYFLPKDAEMRIQHGLTDKYHRAIDMTEGSVLQEAIEHYINSNMKPSYSNGEFIFTMTSYGEKKLSTNLAHILKNEFKLISRPLKERIEIGKSIVLETLESEDAENEEQGVGNVNKREARQGGKARQRSSMREIIITEKAMRHGGNVDESLEFVKTAFRWYVKNKENTLNTQRYLYYPLKDGDSNDMLNETRLMKVARYPLYDIKSFNSLFFPEKEKLIALIDQFQSKTGKFAVPGFPHKITLLLYGPPGTGKTSLVKAIAQYTGRHIFSIPLCQLQTNRELIAFMHDQFFELENDHLSSKVSLRADKVIYLLEDADATADVMLAKKKCGQIKNSKFKKSDFLLTNDFLSVKGLLDAFGGILDSSRRIVVITTNHIERLNSAFIRPGIITMRLHMGNFTKTYALQMIKHYYGINIDTDERLESLEKVLQWASDEDICFSPSEIEQFCAEYDDIEGLIEALKKGSKQNIF